MKVVSISPAIGELVTTDDPYHKQVLRLSSHQWFCKPIFCDTWEPIYSAWVERLEASYQELKRTPPRS